MMNNVFFHTKETADLLIRCQAELDDLLAKEEYSFLKNTNKRVLKEQKGVILEVDYQPEESVLMSGYHFLYEYFKQVGKPIILSSYKEFDNVDNNILKAKKKKQVTPSVYMIAEDFDKVVLPESAINYIMLI